VTKKKAEKIDGLSPKDKQKIRSAIRQVWHRSYARKLCIERCTDEEGFPTCEGCGKRVAKITVDHIVRCGELDGGFIERMFVPSSGLKALCKKCHDAKTKLERNKDRMRKTQDLDT
jgi:hypothetical protein